MATICKIKSSAYVIHASKNTGFNGYPPQKIRDVHPSPQEKEPYGSSKDATGEKSGEMLAVAKFSSSDEQPAPENQGGGAGDDENPEQGLGF